MKQKLKYNPFEQDLADKRAVCGSCRSTTKKSTIAQMAKPATELFEQDIPVRNS